MFLLISSISDINPMFYWLYGYNNNTVFYLSYWYSVNFYFSLFLLCCLILVIILYLVSFFISTKFSSFEKNSAYECGFELFGMNSHSTFPIQYQIIGILFMLFDLEIAYLFVWALNIGILPIYSFFFILYFLLILCFGFIYEWKKGALSWV